MTTPHSAPARSGGLLGVARRERPNEWALLVLAAAIYCLLSWVGHLPGSLHLFSQYIHWFEDSAVGYRVYWFSHILFGGGEGTIWFMPDILWPQGIATLRQSGGMLKELLAACLGGGSVPWLASNLLVVSNPVTVALTMYLVLRRWFRAAFLPALAAGWVAGWCGIFLAHMPAPWMASTEGLIVYLGALLRMRTSASPRRWALAAGVGAGLAVWLQLQHLNYVVVIGGIFLADRLLARDGKRIAWFALAGGLGAVIAAPLLYQAWKAFGGDAKSMAGDSSLEAIFLWRNRLTQFVLPPTGSIPLGWLTAWLKGIGWDLGPHPSPYLGYTVLLAAGFGAARRARGRWLLVAVALVSLILSCGPILSVFDSPGAPSPLWGKSWVPGPYYFLREWPLFNTMRVPGRFLTPAPIALAFLACAGVARVLRARAFHRRPVLRPVAVAGFLALQLLDINLWPVTFFPAQVSPWYREVAKEPGDFAMLDIPAATSYNQYMHFGAYHHKKVIWGFGGRVPAEVLQQQQEKFRFFGILDHDPKTWNRDYARFAKALVEHRVKYICVHELDLDRIEVYQPYRKFVYEAYENDAGWATQDWIRPLRRVHHDPWLTVYEVVPLRSPDGARITSESGSAYRAQPRDEARR